MAQMINRRRMMGGKALPYDAEVEYLGNSGGQWIDTGIIINAQDYGLVIEGSVTAPLSSVGAVRWSNTNYPTYGVARGSSTSLGCVIYYGKQYKTIATPDNGTYIYYLNIDGKLGVKNTDGSVVREFMLPVDDSVVSNVFSMPLFAFNNQGNVSSQYQCRICSAKIMKAGSVIADYIPVRIGSVGYMYDRISGRLYGNRGTGQFVVGADKN